MKLKKQQMKKEVKDNKRDITMETEGTKMSEKAEKRSKIKDKTTKRLMTENKE